MIHKVHKVKKHNYSDSTTRKLSPQFLEDNLETSIAEVHQKVQSPMLNDHRKQKKRKSNLSLSECESSEIVTVDFEKDISDVRTKKKRKREKERNGSRSEEQCNGSEVQNLRLADHAEIKKRKKEKRKKKERDKCTLLRGCDGAFMVDSDLVHKNVHEHDDSKKHKKKKRFSESGAAHDSLLLEKVCLFGEQRKKKHHSRSAESNCVSQICAVEIEAEKKCPKLSGIENKQKNNKISHSCLAENRAISKPKAKTDKEKDCSIALNGDDILGIPANGTTQSVHNSKSVDGKAGKKKKKKKKIRHCSSSAESGDVFECISEKIEQQIQNSAGKAVRQKKKTHHYRSPEGESGIITENPCEGSAILESAAADMETSFKKRKKRKMQCDISLDDTDVLHKSVKKCKKSRVLPSDTHVETNCNVNVENLGKPLKKHKVKCNTGGILQNTAAEHSMATQDTNSAESNAEWNEQAVHNCSQETVKISKKLKRKKESLLKGKSSKRNKISSDVPEHYSDLSSDNIFQVVNTTETVTKPSKILKTQKKKNNSEKQQLVIVSDDNIDNTSAEQPQEESIYFDQDNAKVMQMSKSKLVEVLKDFVPNAEKLTSGTMYHMYKYDLPRLKKFKEEGVPIRQGRFRKEENEQLQKNLNELMELTGIENEWEFFNVPESFDEMIRIKRLKQNNLFCIKLAEGIPRPWKSVYQRAKKVYDPNRYKGKYTEEELKKLNKLHKVYGNRWIKIAKLMDRTDTSVICRARLFKKSLNLGAWSKEEVRTFMKIMENIMKERIKESHHDRTITDSDTKAPNSIFRESLYKNLPWRAIADQMKHRNWLQCRQKWMNILTTKMSGGSIEMKKNNYQYNINLIERLYQSGVDDIGEVDWEELCSAVGDVPPSAIQRRFYYLKYRHVPNWTRKSFGAIVEFLHVHIVPKMEAVLGRKQRKEDIYQPQHHMFQLSKIFSDIEDEDDYIESIHPLEEHIETSVQTPVEETN
ncbi:uncharacterized protein LOC144608243 [Rhinoraja longicauda]